MYTCIWGHWSVWTLVCMFVFLCICGWLYILFLMFLRNEIHFFTLWITWYITLILIFILGYANKPSAFYKTTRCHQEDAGNDNFVISFLYFHFRWIRYCFMRLLDIYYSEGTCIFYISKKFMCLRFFSYFCKYNCLQNLVYFGDIIQTCIGQNWPFFDWFQRQFGLCTCTQSICMYIPY